MKKDNLYIIKEMNTNLIGITEEEEATTKEEGTEEEEEAIEVEGTSKDNANEKFNVPIVNTPVILFLNAIIERMIDKKESSQNIWMTPIDWLNFEKENNAREILANNFQPGRPNNNKRFSQEEKMKK